MIWAKTVVRGLGCILKLNPIEFVHGLVRKGEEDGVYMTLYFKKKIVF